MIRSRLTNKVLIGLILGTAGIAAPIWAQSYDTGGIQLNFGVRLGFDAASNRTLAASDEKGTVEARAALSFGLLTETRTQKFSLNLGGSIRDISGSGDTGLNTGFNSPSIATAYSRETAGSRISLRAGVSERDLSDNALVFDEETGEFFILDGDAIQRRSSYSAKYSWGTDRPFGFGVSAGLLDISYRNGIATGVGGSRLDDSTRMTFGTNVRFDLNDVTRLNTSLRYETFEEDAVSGSRETISLNNSLTYDRPLGALKFNLGITDTEDGTRYSASAGRSYALPSGALSGQLGVTRGVTGDTTLNGSLSATRELPNGSLTAALSRSVSSGNAEDTERTNNSVRLGYSHELTPLSGVGVNFSWADSTVTSSGLSTTDASLTASYRRTLTQDWNMNLGYRHRYRQDNDNDTARSNELFMNLNRSFVTRF